MLRKALMAPHRAPSELPQTSRRDPPAAPPLQGVVSMDVISNFAARYERSREEELSIEEYLAECRRNPVAYATAAERMLKAIGDPKLVDTRNDPRMSRTFANKVIKIHPALDETYGMMEAIELE